MQKQKKSKSSLIQSVDRALQILETFSREKKELGVTELSNILGLHKSTTFGLLATLENRGFVDQNISTGKYKLGLKLFELGNLVKDSMELRAIAYPILKELVDKYEETVHLVVHDKGEVVYIDKIDSNSAININSYVGKRNPMYCTGVGKCLLAYMDAEYVENILSSELKAYTANTIVDPEKIKDELVNARLNGYCFDNEEIEEGLRCIAAPIKNHLGQVIAAISVSGPSMRMTDQKFDLLIEPVKETTLKISRQLGYRGV